MSAQQLDPPEGAAAARVSGVLIPRPPTLTTEQRMRWLCDMHTLHYGLRFLYAVTAYHLYITYDGDEIREYEADESESADGDMDGAWGLVIDRAAAAWAAESKGNERRPPWRRRIGAQP